MLFCSCDPPLVREPRDDSQCPARPSIRPDADDARVPFDQGRQLAAGIAGARFVPLPSHNHLILEGEPAFPKFLQEIRAFLAT